MKSNYRHLKAIFCIRRVLETEKHKVLGGGRNLEEKSEFGLRKKLKFFMESKGGFLDSTKLRLEDQLEQGISGKGSYFCVCCYTHFLESYFHNSMLN